MSLSELWFLSKLSLFLFNSQIRVQVCLMTEKRSRVPILCRDLSYCIPIVKIGDIFKMK